MKASPILVMLCLAMVALCANAQGQRVLDEPFNALPGSWSVAGASSEPQLVDGSAELVSADTAAALTYTTTVALERTHDWSIRCRTRQRRGDADQPMGLVFWSDNRGSYYEFSYQRNGQARLRLVQNLLNEDIQPWVAASPANVDEWVELEIRKQHDAVTCFVQGRPCATFTVLDFPSYGNAMGVIVRGAQRAAFDDFRVMSMPPTDIRIVNGADETLRPVNLGAIINSAADESVDCLSPDGSMLVFSRRDHLDNMPPIHRSDIWIATKRADGSWNAPQNPGAPINTPGNNYAIALTQDLNMMFVNGRYNDDGSIKRGVSVTKRTASGWSKPVAITINGFVNTSRSMTSHIAADGSFMVLSIETPSSRGGNDLYVSRRLPNGSWAEPVNMGDSVNTIGMEIAPFIAADGSSIYFSSDGHRGYGGRDIFVSRRLDSTLMHWSRPENLGRGINTPEHESFFNVSAKGDSAYFSSENGAIGKSDIFSIAMPKGAKPEALLGVRGRVIDASTQQPIEAEIIYEDLEQGTVAGTAQSSPSDGSYRVTLKGGVRYGVRAQTAGYYPLSNDLDARDLEDYKEVEQDLQLSPIVMNVAIRLNNVFFDSGKWDLRPESFPELDRLTQFMQTNASMEIHIAGHTDDIGKDADNLQLSRKRAESVREYVVRNGVDGARLTFEGYGETQPLAANDSDAGRQRNRRVEFTITKK